MTSKLTKWEPMLSAEEAAHLKRLRAEIGPRIALVALFNEIESLLPFLDAHHCDTTRLRALIEKARQ